MPSNRTVITGSQLRHLHLIKRLLETRVGEAVFVASKWHDSTFSWGRAMTKWTVSLGEGRPTAHGPGFSLSHADFPGSWVYLSDQIPAPFSVALFRTTRRRRRPVTYTKKQEFLGEGCNTMRARQVSQIASGRPNWRLPPPAAQRSPTG